MPQSEERERETGQKGFLGIESIGSEGEQIESLIHSKPDLTLSMTLESTDEIHFIINGFSSSIGTELRLASWSDNRDP